MLFRREKKRVPELNTTSTADISFMLLILFLVTTSMDIDKGLSRQLPPPVQEEQAVADVDEGLVLHLQITDDNRLLCNGDPLRLGDLSTRVATHAREKGRQHIVQIETDRHAAYDTYFRVQNEIVKAYNSLRNALARQRYGRPYAQCSDEQQQLLRNEVPQRVSEIYQDAKGGEP